jgi:hypothetical protein
MKCILHIGTEKTGTTTLQEFLHLNRKLLNNHNYLYTKSAGLRNNQALPVAAFNENRRDDFTQRHGIEKNQDLIAFQTRTVNALKAELKDAEGIHTTIFSSEHIQSRLLTNDELSRLKNILNQLGFEKISVIVYLRSPEEIANSLYSTAIKSGWTIANTLGPEDEYWRNICDHRNTLRRFRNQFGLDAVIPRIYSKADLVNGSIVDDFMEAIGLPLSKEKFVLPEPQNKNMNVNSLEILRRINEKIPMFGDDDRPNPLRGNIDSYVLEHFDKGDPYGMPVKLRHQYQEFFKESNEWVRSEYFPNRQTLFELTNIPPVSESSFNDSELDQIAHIICAIWLDKSRDLSQYKSGKVYRLIIALEQQNRRVVNLLKRLANHFRPS